MRLYSSPTSPFARKVRIVAHELSLKLDEINVSPRKSDALRRLNPLGKVPTLALDDGSVLFDSPVICEYLNQACNGTFFPGVSMFRNSTGRWRAHVLHALGDGVCEVAGFLTLERRLPAERRDEDEIAHQERTVRTSLDALERLVAKFAEAPTIGEIAVACALGYLDFRHSSFAWRDDHTSLAGWFEKFSNYPSMTATAPKDLA